MTKRVIPLLLLVLISAVTTVNAADVEFKFEIPPLPYPPVISDVWISTAGETGIFVAATITGSVQKKGFCWVSGVKYEDPGDHPDCAELTNWVQEAHPDITPNPPAIKKAILGYRLYEDNSESAGSVPLTYNSSTGDFEGSVPCVENCYTSNSLSVTVWITAVDHFGNVVSQVPDKSSAPCIAGTASWDPTLSTPAWDTCDVVEQYEECAVVQTGSPTGCSTSYTMNDRAGDTCGEPNSNGDQTVLASPVNKADIQGISVGGDANRVCVRLGLGASPPSSSDSPPIEGYLVVFFNPDETDSNPGDTHIENAYAITYAPEAQASDPTLVRVLWNGDCVTNPDTADPLGCKIKSAVPGDTALSMAYSNGALVFTANKSWSTQWGNVSLVGANSNSTQIVALTGEINLSGDNLFWLVDMTSGMGLELSNKTSTFIIEDIQPPMILAEECDNGLANSPANVCGRSAAKPENNVCRIQFADSLWGRMVGSFNVYETVGGEQITDANKSDFLVATIANDTTGTYTHEETITGDALDGVERKYYLTSVSVSGSSENDISDASLAACTPEDWSAPAAPVEVSAATPAGKSAVCEVKWKAGAADATLDGFILKRDGAPPEGVFVSASGTYSWSDPDTLTNGATYAYTIVAVDESGNESTAAAANCVPRDLEQPEAVGGVMAVNKSAPGVRKVALTWTPGAEDDLKDYSVHRCDAAASACAAESNFVQVANGISAATHEDTTMPAEGDYVYYVEAFDDAGNGSGFPPADCRDCFGRVTVSEDPDLCKPSFPTRAGITTEAPSEGGKCVVRWMRVSTNANPSADCAASFDAANPASKDLLGYRMMMVEDTGANMPYPNESPASVKGFVSALGDPEFTIDGLTNNRKYFFMPFSVDGNDNYPPAPAPEGVECTPKDILPPASTVAAFACAESECVVTWNAVEDPDRSAWNLYRCDGEAAECASDSDFTLILGAISRDTTSHTDATVDLEQPYTWCVTAKDPWGNESAISGGANCANYSPIVCKSEIKTVRLGPLNKIDTSDNSCEGFCETAVAGVTLELVSGSETIASGSTGADGYATVKVCGDVCAGGGASLRARLTGGAADGRFCDSTDGGDCLINLEDPCESCLTSGGECGIIISGGGQREIGNATCDNKVDFDDFKQLKLSYKKKSGDGGYLEWADFNGDGEVNFNDFKILKVNYGKTVSGTVVDSPIGGLCCMKKPGEKKCCSISPMTGECE